jgi:trehalose-6-phosphate synthase
MKKFYLNWFIVVTLFAILGASIQSSVEWIRMREETNERANTLLSTLSTLDLAVQSSDRKIAKTIERLRKLRAPSDDVASIAGFAVCTPGAKGRAARGFPQGQNWEEACQNPALLATLKTQKDRNWTSSESSESGNRKLKFYSRADDASAYVLVQDISALQSRWLASFMRFFVVYWLSGLVIAFLIATQLRRWIQNHLRTLHQSIRQSLRSMIAGKQPRTIAADDEAVERELQPINRDIDELAQKILSLSSRQEKKKADAQSSWLLQLKNIMGSRKLLVVANREPYIHQKKENKIEVLRPASGLVTALEPVLRQSGGMWVAHGSGTADKETSDPDGIVGVPPGNEKYKLKRVWLSKEEEEGYYYGFSNEGLWPLCHLAHTRPTFRLTDWSYYQEVNKKFSLAIPEESLNESSVILVQDYHFALLPQMIKNRAKAPRVGLFWHIPWPNAEAFGICPWNKELLHGMLGSDVVAFHTQYHCNNFLETCNRYLEARIDYERFSVTMDNHETLVRAFPIGIDTSPVKSLSGEEISALKVQYGIKAEKIAVGVDRLDYTKGLVERVEAIERFLEKNPEWVGRFSFVQMGSPSRTHIPAYQNLANQLDQVIRRVNARFSVQEDPEYKPVILVSHHSWEDIQYFYQMGDVCLVTSLHDGMNLVAKEYVWCQSVNRGSLILSKFAGASRELTEAFIINPYSVEEIADAISAALALPEEERIARMQAMKAKVAGRNAFHWAADLIKSVVDTEENIQPGLQTGQAGNVEPIVFPKQTSA